MNFETINRPSKMVIGIECRTSNNPGAAEKDIPALWDRFMNEQIQQIIPNKISNEVVALYCDYEGDHTQPYTIVVGCEVSSLDDIPEGLVGKMTPESSFACFKVEGDFPASVYSTWQKIWQSSLNRTFTGDLEVYGEDFFQGSNKVEILIATKS